MDLSYVNEILAAARKANIKTRRQWDELTYADRMAGYHDEVAAAEQVYFAGKK